MVSEIIMLQLEPNLSGRRTKNQQSTDWFTERGTEGFLSSKDPDALQLAMEAYSKLYKAICNNPQHVLTNLSPPHDNSGTLAMTLKLECIILSSPPKLKENIFPKCSTLIHWRRLVKNICGANPNIGGAECCKNC